LLAGLFQPQPSSGIGQPGGGGGSAGYDAGERGRFAPVAAAPDAGASAAAAMPGGRPSR
jgi:hypothetical protein